MRGDGTPDAGIDLPRVVLGTPCWSLNGVNIFSANLARGLRRMGGDARILTTEHDTMLAAPHDAPMDRPPDLPFDELPVRRHESWGAHWGAMLRYLEGQGPCVYLPNSDWRHSCVCPLLSDRVAVCGIVHSDDPLHYDHVARLGRYWNAVVAVSDRVAAETLRRRPDLEPRLSVIPIGVAVPARPLPRRPAAGRPLRALYHGTLKQHQKRVLDLPRIVAAAAARGVPVHLTIAGGGPDEAALAAAAAPLIERGLIRLAGVVPHDTIVALLEEADVYLLASEFEGMPNALLEAMAHGCVPVATRTGSGIPQIVRDGVNGWLVPIGDIGAFADRLAALHAAPERRAAMAEAAHGAVADGPYSMARMVAAYARLFTDVRGRPFERPRGPSSLPPADIGGVGIFPVELRHEEPGIGRFPARCPDLFDFRRHAGWPMPPCPVRRIVFSLPRWTWLPINRSVGALARALGRQGLDVEILLTEEDTVLVRGGEPAMALPGDLTVRRLPVGPDESWGAHWGAMLRFLRERAPCVYVPVHDWRHSCVVPLLPPDVLVFALVPGDDGFHRDHVRRLGPYLNGVIGFDAAVAGAVAGAAPGLTAPVSVLPVGADIPNTAPPPRTGGPPRIGLVTPAPDEAALQAALGAAGLVVPLHVGGPGSGPGAGPGLPEDLWLDTLAHLDAVVFAGGSEPVRSLILEAMGRGCVVAVLGAGIDDHPVRDGETGLVQSDGDADALAARLAAVAADGAARRRLSLAAADHAGTRTPRMDAVAETFMEVVGRAHDAMRAGRFTRPPGPLSRLPAAIDGVGVFPVAPTHEEPGVGAFIAAEPDAADFRRHLGPEAP
ncbi:MAG TPA: glycosyltransferase family 4 protein [Azospirillum sp.]|nr:glycosyltransferase family 4 protein [Azospirillum sp.]